MKVTGRGAEGAKDAQRACCRFWHFNLTLSTASFLVAAAATVHEEGRAAGVEVASRNSEQLSSREEPPEPQRMRRKRGEENTNQLTNLRATNGAGSQGRRNGRRKGGMMEDRRGGMKGVSTVKRERGKRV